MVIEFCTLDDAVYVALHVPDDKLQEDELNVPPTFPSLQVIVPVGVFCEFVVSVTVAVTVTCPPDDTVDADDVIKTDAAS
jgi:hypothetical protein